MKFDINMHVLENGSYLLREIGENYLVDGKQTSPSVQQSGINQPFQLVEVKMTALILGYLGLEDCML